METDSQWSYRESFVGLIVFWSSSPQFTFLCSLCIVHEVWASIQHLLSCNPHLPHPHLYLVGWYHHLKVDYRSPSAYITYRCTWVHLPSKRGDQTPVNLYSLPSPSDRTWDFGDPSPSIFSILQLDSLPSVHVWEGSPCMVEADNSPSRLSLHRTDDIWEYSPWWIESWMHRCGLWRPLTGPWALERDSNLDLLGGTSLLHCCQWLEVSGNLISLYQQKHLSCRILCMHAFQVELCMYLFQVTQQQISSHQLLFVWS